MTKGLRAETVVGPTTTVAAGSPPSEGRAAALAVTAGVVACGNAAVIAARRLGPLEGEVLTLIAIPSLGALACLALVRRGWSREDLGLRLPDTASTGPRRALGLILASAVTAGTVAALARGAGTHSGIPASLFLVRLAGTALGEELAFRGALLSLWGATSRSSSVAFVANAVSFGAWHLAGALPKGFPAAARDVAIAGLLGGALFVWARRRSGSVLGSALLHYAVNLGGALTLGW